MHCLKLQCQMYIDVTYKAIKFSLIFKPCINMWYSFAVSIVNWYCCLIFLIHNIAFLTNWINFLPAKWQSFIVEDDQDRVKQDENSCHQQSYCFPAKQLISGFGWNKKLLARIYSVLPHYFYKAYGRLVRHISIIHA